VDALRNFGALRENSVHYLLQLFLRTDLDNLLAEVVTELVYHHISEEATHRVYQTRNEFRRALRKILKLLLYHSATGLVEGKLFNLANNVEFLRRQIIQIILFTVRRLGQEYIFCVHLFWKLE
jgi:hypothetical protein